MDSKRIEKLLEKYWNAETSLEEEQELHQFFQSTDVPEKLKETAVLFRYFETERSRTLNENFDAAVESTVHWYRANEAWWRKIKSGEYLEYYKRQYAARLAAASASPN